jgi:hypothetical protein
VTLFGVPDPGGEFVLRHRASGAVITAYSAQSGPSYGGGGGDIPAHIRHQELRATPAIIALEDEARDIAIRCYDLKRSKAERARLHARRRELTRRISEHCDPPGYWAAVERLEKLIAAAPPSDYSTIDESGDSGVRRVGVRDGQPFDELFSLAETMELYLDRIAAATSADEASFAAITLFHQLHRAPSAQRSTWTPRVREAWLRLLELVEEHGKPDELSSLCELLYDFAGRLGVDDEARERLAQLATPQDRE